MDIFITKNNKFLFILDNGKIEVWNVESKILDKTLPTMAKCAGLTLTSDSKYLFHVTDNNEITQYDLAAAKNVCKYQNSHRNSTKRVTSLAVNTLDNKLVSCC